MKDIAWLEDARLIFMMFHTFVCIFFSAPTRLPSQIYNDSEKFDFRKSYLPSDSHTNTVMSDRLICLPVNMAPKDKAYSKICGFATEVAGCVWTAANGRRIRKKNLWIKKYPNTWGRGLKLKYFLSTFLLRILILFAYVFITSKKRISYWQF